MTDDKDYKKIAEALAERLIFALENWKYTGGLAYNPVTGKGQTPMRYFAEGLKLMGYEIADADLNALALPAAAKRRYFATREKAKPTMEIPITEGDQE